MSDNYQAVFDAVRSRLSNGDIGSAIENAIRSCSLDHYASMASIRAIEAAAMYDLPSVLYRPKLSMDGDHWIALYGDNLQDGVAGCGKSPELAMRDFDKVWFEKIKK